MDEDEELIERLLTAAGSIMEDTSEAALIRGGAHAIAARIAAVDAAGADIATLARAAAIVRRRRAGSRRS